MTSHDSPRRIAIVTAASRHRGIGAATCQALAQAGIDIFFTHWSPYDYRMPWGAEEDEPIQLLLVSSPSWQAKMLVGLLVRSFAHEAGSNILF